MLEDAEPNINLRIATQVRGLRGRLGVSLDGLARHSGVSRSMISLIERGEANPTAVVLERLAFGLGVPLAQLFAAPGDAPPAPAPVSRRAAQCVWRDPGSGYLRRQVSPEHWPSPVQLVEIEFPPGARVNYETGARSPAVDQQVWVLAGRIDVGVGRMRYELDAGDCLAMRLDQPVSFHNPGTASARYVVVISIQGPAVHRPGARSRA